MPAAVVLLLFIIAVGIAAAAGIGVAELIWWRRGNS